MNAHVCMYVLYIYMYVCMHVNDVETKIMCVYVSLRMLYVCMYGTTYQDITFTCNVCIYVTSCINL